MEDKNYLVDLINTVIDKRMEEYYKTYKFFDKFFWVGEVDTVDLVTNTATILLPNQTTATSPKPNKTNQELEVGDVVMLFSPQGTLGTSFIFTTNEQNV